MLLSEKTIIVTGAGGGLGEGIARICHREGANVMIADVRGDAAARVAAALGARAQAQACDVRDDAALQTLVEETVRRFGRIDGLVNNAGRGMREISEEFNRKPALFWQADPQGFRNIVEANVQGAFLMARACVPAMVAQGFGRVVNISTSQVTMVRTGYCPYGPSKAALEAMSVIWSRDLQGTGVTTNVLLPGGATDTALLPGSGSDRRGADGQLLAPSLMRAPLLWLMTGADSSANGHRYVAKLWPQDLPADQAAARARSPATELPAIM